MKKSIIIAIAAVTIFAACKKEIDGTQNNANSNGPVVNPSAMAKPAKTPTGYAGGSTLGDSTKMGK